MDGELEEWWEGTVGVATDSLLPSVRFAVESALVAAMAHACGAQSLADHLFAGALADVCRGDSSCSDAAGGVGEEVAVNALIDLTACPAQLLCRDWVAEQAAVLEAKGFLSIKVKVCTRASLHLGFREPSMAPQTHSACGVTVMPMRSAIVLLPVVVRATCLCHVVKGVCIYTGGEKYKP